MPAPVPVFGNNPSQTCDFSKNACACAAAGGTSRLGLCTKALACCLPNGTSYDDDPICCAVKGGVSYQGSVSEVHSCCFSDGTCQDLDPCTCSKTVHVLGGEKGVPGGGLCADLCCGGPNPVNFTPAPLPGNPFPPNNLTELCDIEQTDRGEPLGDPPGLRVLPYLIPPPNPLGPTFPPSTALYDEELAHFLRSGDYRFLRWLSDAHMRMTGPYGGTPPFGTDFETHPGITVYYSPDVIEWLCKDRKGHCSNIQGQCSNAGQSGAPNPFPCSWDSDCTWQGHQHPCNNRTLCSSDADCGVLGATCELLPAGAMISVLSVSVHAR
jgi:hypothetical protein